MIMAETVKYTFDLDGVRGSILLEKILKAVDDGYTTEQIRKHPEKFLVSGKTKKIVISKETNNLPLCYVIIKELANRGDEYSKSIIDNDKGWKQISDDGCFSRSCKLKNIPEQDRCNVWFDFSKCIDYRTSKHLIDIIEEGKLENIGGWGFEVKTVYEEDWSYRIECAYGEYVVGALD